MAMAYQKQSAWRFGAVRRELRGVALALLMVAAMTVIAYVLNQYLDVRRGSVIYLIPVLLAGWHLGLMPALVAAVAGVLWSGYFFFAPFYTYFDDEEALLKMAHDSRIALEPTIGGNRVLTSQVVHDAYVVLPPKLNQVLKRNT